MKKASLPQPTVNLAAKILGIWRLKSREDVDAAGQVQIDPFLGRDPLGILCFGPTHFAAQFMKRDRSRKENVPQRVRTKNNTAAVNGYDAYFGTYTVEKSAAPSRRILKDQSLLRTLAPHMLETCEWCAMNSLFS